jgi:hypothetical protein
MIIPSVSGSGNTLEIIASASDAATLIVEVVGGKGKRVGLTITQTALAQALRDVGLYVTTLGEAQDALATLTTDLREENEDQTAKLMAITAVLERTDMREDAALQEVYNILHPAPPYMFPKGFGAIVEGIHKVGGGRRHFQLTATGSPGSRWLTDRGTWIGEDDIRDEYKDLETIFEGIDE